MESNDKMFIEVFNARLHWKKHRFYCCFVLLVCKIMLGRWNTKSWTVVSFTAKQSDVLHIVCVQWKPCISKLDEWLFKKKWIGLSAKCSVIQLQTAANQITFYLVNRDKNLKAAHEKLTVWRYVVFTWEHCLDIVGIITDCWEKCH